ncbi:MULTISPECIES: hypothetical protein [Sporomusa]|nr:MULTISPECIES: hypothetical protein [Sporomusa]HML31784.1 hypothetical protein [Sporomusa sphaeroides]
MWLPEYHREVGGAAEFTPGIDTRSFLFYTADMQEVRSQKIV